MGISETQLDYLRLLVFKDIFEVLLICSLIACFLSLSLVYRCKIKETRIRNKKGTYVKGYDKAMEDAERRIRAFYDEWESDDPLAYVPNKEHIITFMKDINYAPEGGNADDGTGSN